MIYKRMPALLRALPEGVQRHVLYFEAQIEDALRAFSAELPPGSRVLDAGAGETQYAELFRAHRYFAVDLGIGDADWSYNTLDAVARLENLPFADRTFAGCMNVVTLEHVPYPGAVLAELARVLKPGGKLLLATPLEWEEHQQPFDYFRYTRFGIEHLVTRAGLVIERLEAVGGLFRLIARRLLNAGQMAPWLMPFVGPPALLFPLLDRVDRNRHFTFGHICIARKP